MIDKWTKRFLDLAKMYASWSKDPSTQVGAVIVNDRNQQVGQGYNGFPRGVEDKEERLKDRDFKYSVILHAEENALLNSQGSLEGCTLYVWPFLPCSNCASRIIQTGIKRVVSIDRGKNSRWDLSHNLAKSLLKEGGVEVNEIIEEE